jgi:hypothetical protein
MKAFARSRVPCSGTPNSLDASPTPPRTRSALKQADSSPATASPTTGSPGRARANAARSKPACAPVANGAALTARTTAAKRKADSDLTIQATKYHCGGGASDDASPSAAFGKPKVFTRRGRCSPSDAEAAAEAAAKGPASSPGNGMASSPVKVRNVVPWK